MVAVINEYLNLIVVVGGGIISIVGTIAGLHLKNIKNHIKANRQLREDDKAEIMKEINRIEKHIHEVEKTAHSNTESTMQLFMEIKSELANIAGKIEVFFKK